MVDGPTLLTDVGETAAYFAAPLLLWLFAYLFAYRDHSLAASAGFDRLTFWLLIPGAVLGEFANVLVFGYRSDLLAINVGGGLIPAALSIWLLGRIVEDRRRTLTLLMAPLIIGTFVALGAELLALRPAIADGLIVVGLIGPAALTGVAYLRRGAITSPSDRSIVLGTSLLFGLTALGTFATTSTVPGTGIVSAFPVYLILPVLAGAGATYALGRWGHLADGPCLAIAYAGVTLGELVGADVLHQPPLYAVSGPALYAIGGAGVLDLLHLSGLLALAGAVAVVAYRERAQARPRREPRGASSAVRRIRRAWYLGLEGAYLPSIRESALATHEAVADLRRLARIGPMDPRRPWEGLPVPAWVPLDQANLDAVAADPPDASGREAYRSWLTARALVGTASAIAQPYRPTAWQRSLAFAIDIGILALLSAAIDFLVVGSIPGPLGPVLNGIALNAAVVGGVGWGLMYFVALEGFTDATPGKRVLGLRVQARGGGPADPRAIALRNLPRVVPLTILAYVVGLGIAVGTHPSHAASVLAAYGGVVPFVAEVVGVALIGLGLIGLVSLLTIGATEEAQRLGDVVAGTSVVRVPEAAGAPVRPTVRAEPAASRPGAG